MINPFKKNDVQADPSQSYNVPCVQPEESSDLQPLIHAMLYSSTLGSANSTASSCYPHGTSYSKENLVDSEVSKNVINILKSLNDLEESIKGLKNFNTKVLEDRGWYNYYRVLHMSPEELAHFIVVDCRSIVAGADDAEECLTQYLKSET